MENVTAMVLAGGCGQRLWPLSREGMPKQLIPFVDGQSLLQQSITRLQQHPLISKENIMIVTSAQYADIIQASVGDHVGRVVSEPVGRNTGPAVLYGCLFVQQQNPDSVVVVLPADHFIPDTVQFNAALTRMIECAIKQDSIALLGLKPHSAATGYGYIQAGPENTDDGVFTIERFHEKPSQQLADFYLQQPDYYWNLGIFVARASVLVSAFAAHAPLMYEQVVDFVAGRAGYDQVQKVSIDYCLMEKAKNLVMVPADFDWYDIGNLATFLSVRAAHSTEPQPVVSLHGENNLALTHKKIVAFLGLSEVCLVETDDAILVVDKKFVEEVRQLLPAVKAVESSLV